MVLPLALTLHGLLQPGPLKQTVLLDELELEPYSVMVNACPLIGGFGLVLMLWSTGGMRAPTPSGKPSPTSPGGVVLDRDTEGARGQDSLVVLAAALVLHGEPHPGPLKYTVLLASSSRSP